MWRGILVALMLAGCVQVPPTPNEIRALKFESVPDKAVIYIARPYPDLNNGPAPIVFGNVGPVVTYPGTYYRWETTPGRNVIVGYLTDLGRITLETQAGRIYFVEQRVVPPGDVNTVTSHFRLVDEARGREIVSQGRIVPGGG